jgi:hypothetical protein
VDQNDPVSEAEDRLEGAEQEEDPARLEALTQLHDILETELERPEETSAESHAEEVGTEPD